MVDPSDQNLRVREVFDRDSGELTGWYFFCPGCNTTHQLFTPEARRRIFNVIGGWTFNNNFREPTFRPSLLVRVGPFPDSHFTICHSIIKDGKIKYLKDCTHALKEKTIPLPYLPAYIQGA